MSAWARPRVPRPGPRAVDAAVAVSLLGLMLVSVATTAVDPNQRPTDVGAYVLCLGLSLPYAVHRRYPLGASAVVLASVLAFSALQYAAYPALGLFVLLFGIALHADRRKAVVAIVASVAVMVVGLAVQPSGVADASAWTTTLLAIGIAWLAGDAVRNRRARWAAMEERAARLEREQEEQARQAVAAERLRIARELHDVVAHSMSVIAVQSGVGHHVIDTDPAQAKQALATVEEVSREALVEMRRLLGVLREEGASAASLEPAAGIDQLTALVDRVRSAGLAVDLRLEGDPAGCPAVVSLSAYRLVQEALTNVIKHGGPVATVRVRGTGSEVLVEVSDDGRPGAVPPPPAPRAGHGLAGMRERVTVFGGELDAGPRPGGGFRVAARLPYGAGAA